MPKGMGYEHYSPSKAPKNFKPHPAHKPGPVPTRGNRVFDTAKTGNPNARTLGTKKGR